MPTDHATIQEAIDAAQSGDLIKVAQGVYAAFAIDGKTNLTIKGKGNPVVDGGGAAAVVVAGVGANTYKNNRFGTEQLQ